MSISAKIQKNMVQSSWIRRMFEEGTRLKQRYGSDKVFDLSLGNPIMEPPAAFFREFKGLADHPVPGVHRYMENAGYAETRAAVAEMLSEESGLKFTADHIVMTCGAAGAINIALKTILDPGDEVILFTPYFVEYIHYIDNHGGIARPVPTDEQFVPRLNAIEAAISPKTKAVIINSPNNPTGAVYSDKFLQQLGQMLEEKQARFGRQIFLIGDEAYRRIIFDGIKLPQIWHHYRHSILVTSHSKDLSLPGERIGYLAIHPDIGGQEELINGLIFCNRVLGFVNAPSLMQYLVRRLQKTTVSVADYQKKRDFLYENLTGMGYSMVKPQGAFYIFPKSPLPDDIAFVKELLQQKVLTVPGQGFGVAGYFRLAYCVDDRTLEGSLAGFRKAIQKYK